MSKADKMFKDLGYIQSMSDENDKYYRNEYVDYEKGDTLITFDISSKLLVLSHRNYDIAISDIEELSAIFTKAIELGWIK